MSLIPAEFIILIYIYNHCQCSSYQSKTASKRFSNSFLECLRNVGRWPRKMLEAQCICDWHTNTYSHGCLLTCRFWVMEYADIFVVQGWYWVKTNLLLSQLRMPPQAVRSSKYKVAPSLTGHSAAAWKQLVLWLYELGLEFIEWTRPH